MPYAILITHQSGRETELCRVGTNPEAVAEGARRKTYRVKHTRRWWRLPLYRNVRVVEVPNAPER
jgi:hypothetical protein